jgi:hypothetical protein
MCEYHSYIQRKDLQVGGTGNIIRNSEASTSEHDFLLSCERFVPNLTELTLKLTTAVGVYSVLSV